MSRKEFEQIDVPKSLGAKVKLQRLCKLLAKEKGVGRIMAYDAVTLAIAEAIERRAKK